MWEKVKGHNEWRFYINPFTAYIFLEDNCAHCVVRFGLKTDNAVVAGKGGMTNLDAGKEWALGWLDSQLEEFSKKLIQSRSLANNGS